MPSFKNASGGLARELAEAIDVRLDHLNRRAGIQLRLISSLILATVTLTAVWAGSPYFDLLILFAGIQLAREWTRVVTGSAIGFATLPLSVVVGAAIIMAASGATGEALLLSLIGSMIFYVLARRRKSRAPLTLAMGVLVIALPAIGFDWLQSLPERFGTYAILWLLAVVIATDTGAYMFGKAIGGRQLAPKISPNKTWAGAIGGMLAAAIISAVLAVPLHLAIPMSIAVGLATGLVAQLGDLAESAFKRRFGVKDTGGLLPGHGGLLDRVDGLLAGSAFFALLMSLMERYNMSFFNVSFGM